MIALIIAGLVLLAVGGNSYKNYLRTQYEKEYGVLEQHQEVTNVNQVPASGQQGGSNVVTSTLDPGASPYSQSIPSANSPNSAAPVQTRQVPPPSAYRTGSLPPAQPPVSSSAQPQVAGGDPEIARLQARLKAVEEESALYQQKLNQVRSGVAVAGGAPVAKPVESGSLREVMSKTNKGASPALFPKEGTAGSAQSSAAVEYAKQIKNAPAVSKVLAFDAEWGFVQINAGKDRNISTGARFAVRRGISIVGYVKVTEVSAKMSIAELTSRNEFSETAIKPKKGDDIISWPLF